MHLHKAAGISSVTLHDVPLHARQPIFTRELKTVIQNFKTNISEAYEIALRVKYTINLN